MTEWRDIEPKGHNDWHVQFISHTYVAATKTMRYTWQTHSSKVSFEDAVRMLVHGCLPTWPHAQWRLHNYKLNETIPGELFVDALRPKSENQ